MPLDLVNSYGTTGSYREPKGDAPVPSEFTAGSLVRCPCDDQAKFRAASRVYQHCPLISRLPVGRRAGILCDANLLDKTSQFGLCSARLGAQ